MAQAIYSILFDDKRPGTIYAGSYFDDVDGGYYPGPEGGSIFVSQDNGASWTKNQHDFGSPVHGDRNATPFTTASSTSATIAGSLPQRWTTG